MSPLNAFRRFAFLLPLVLLAFIFFHPSSAGPRSNIVLILTDDQRFDTVQFMPTVQHELADKGVTYANNYVTTSNCCPSRSSILTGLYAHNTRILANRAPSGGEAKFHRLAMDQSTIATWLHQAGYRTSLVGKYMNGYTAEAPYQPPGWDDWHAFVADGPLYYNYSLAENGRIVPYGTRPADYSTDVLLQKAIDFLRQIPRGQPFFLYFAPRAPHLPAAPAPRHRGAYAKLEQWRPPNLNELDLTGKPPWIRMISAIWSPALQHKRDAIRKRMLESLLAVDEAVAQILDQLEKMGALHDTLIIFTSDNGFMWGEHWWEGKEAAYEESVRVPMVARLDSAMKPPYVEHGFSLNIDIAPTVASVAHVAPPKGVDGMDIAATIRGQPIQPREFLLEYWNGGAADAVPTFTAIRRKEWKLVHYDQDAFDELYDLNDDPYELHNLASLADKKPLIDDLRIALEALKQDRQHQR